MFAGIYYGGMYGGSTTSILLNTPGESSSVMSAVEGHQMARAGRGGAALATAAIGSFVAGTLGTAALTVCAPVMVEFALRIGPAEYLALAVLAFVAVSAMLGESRLNGFASLLFGLVLGVIGIDPLTGVPRLTLGIPQLLDGIDVVVVAVGLFAVGEVLYTASRHHLNPEIVMLRGSLWMTREEWARSWKAWLRGAAIGFPLGTLPAGGAEIPTFLSYALERRLARDPNEFGHGAIEGVAGPEAANNAAAAGALVPLLALGLPTSATAAIMLAAFQQYGLQPGPLLFQHEPKLVWGLIASLYVGNVMLLVLNLPLVGLWVRLLTIPRSVLYSAILILSSAGVYSVNRSAFDVGLLYAIGGIGYLMRCRSIPLAPAIIGVILGPMAEQQLRRALAIADGSPLVLVTRPISAALLATALLLLAGPRIVGWWRRRQGTDVGREVLAGEGGAGGDEVGGRALEDDPAAVVAGAGAEVDDPVGVRHDRLVVLDDDDRLAGVDEPVEQAEQLLDVGEVEAGGRLVEDVDAALLGHVGGQLEPLPLAAGQRRERLAEAEVAEPDVGEPVEDRVRGRRARLAGAEELLGLGHRHREHLADVAAAERGIRAPTAWNRFPSHSSQVVATPAIIPRSV